MPDIGKAYVQIIPTTKGISSAVTKELAPAGDAGTTVGTNFGKKLLASITKLGIGTAIVKSIKDSLEAGGNLQQSFGGLDTLYGDASAAAKEYAMAAAQAGISANDYAEQAVSFGASLKAAFGGDTVKAAEAANTAIMDMADNSAKMGTDISAIQSAYQGFAKQNYTMLDNLKLGYGGTKTEMERLLKDAQKLSGVKYDINNLGDVYSAIHVIQENLGLTGVAAQEASETFTGSFNAMKASLTNVMAAMTTGADITQPLTQLMTSAGDFLFKNLIPMLGNFVSAVPGALSTVLQTIAPQIGTAITDIMGNLPGLLTAGVEMVNGLVNGILQGLPGFVSTAITMVGEFASSIILNLPTILQAGADILLNLVNGIVQNFPNLVTSAFSAIIEFAGGIADKLPEILQKGIEILGELAAGIIQAIPDLVAKLPEVFTAIKDKFTQYDWIQIGKDILAGIGNGIKNAVDGLIGAAGEALGGLVGGIKGMFKIGSPSKLMAEEVGQWIPAGIAEGIEKNLDVLDPAMSDLTAAVTGNTYVPGQQYSMTDDLSRIITQSDNNVNVNVYLEGDANQIFKVVRKQNTKFKGSTGKSAFDY